MEMVSTLLAICEWNPPVISGFPSQKSVMKNVDALFAVTALPPIGIERENYKFQILNFSVYTDYACCI